MAGTSGIRTNRRLPAIVAAFVCVAAAVMCETVVAPSEASAGWPWKWRRGAPPCGHAGCRRDRCIAADGWAGN